MIDIKSNLLKSLRPPTVSLEEFLSVLSRHFPSAVHETETNFVLYPKDPPHEVRTEFDTKGNLTGLFALSAFSNEKLDSIHKDIQKEFVISTGVGINRHVFFSFYPVRGWWRYQDRFQILPVPSHAPTVPFSYGEHPFLIEYTYPKSDDGKINASRRIREASKLRLLLNAILVPSVLWISPQHVGTLSHRWTLTSTEPASPKVEYLQEFYTYKDSAPLDFFSPINDLPRITEVLTEEYYGERHIPTGDPLDLPSDLTVTLDRFFSLDDTLQDQFLHACYWLSQANQTPSFSLMLLSAVQAIEALIRMPKGSKPCPTCGLMMGPGPTKCFTKFVEVFLPDFMKAKSGLGSIYKTRSGLTHGFAPPLLVDTGPMFSGLNPKDIEQRDSVGEALRIARMCLRNWLNSEPFIHDHVATAAYFIWQKDGCMNGGETEHWLQAITDLRNLNFLSV